MPINSKRKGKRGEIEAVNLLKEYGYDARRSQQYKGTKDSPDIISNFPFYIEVKNKQNLNLYDAVKKTKEDSKESLICIIHKKNNEEFLITFSLKDFLKYLSSKDFQENI